MSAPKYTRGVIPQEPEKIATMVELELRKIQQVLDWVIQSLPFDERNAAPEKVYDGMVVRADGTNWNPGSGQGAYIYYNSAWNYLG